jgi:hypothetical protein
MILFCINYLEDFAIHINPGEMLLQPIISRPDLDLTIQLQTFPDFVNSKGNLILYPYLRLDRIVNGRRTLHEGIGQRKAAALVILKDDLDAWLESVHSWYR